MKWNDYQFSTYTDEDIAEILTLVSALWGNNASLNHDYFTWKHRSNPFLTGDIGIVAKYAGRVIGFLGYVPAEYIVDNNRFMILQQCDTVVHPEHRGKGLFSAMSRAGLQMYGSEYKYVVNFTSNYVTAGGLLKLGWQPLTTVRYLRRLSLPNLLKSRLFPASCTTLIPGRFEDIEVSDKIRASDFSGAGVTGDYAEGKICLNKTLALLEWRLSKPRATYICLYHLTGRDIGAYMVISIKNNHARVFDYGQKPGGPGIKSLLNFMSRNAGFSSITFLDSSTPEALKTFLRKKYFLRFAWIEKIRHGESYSIPIIIRPTVENYAEDDWRIGGVDVRDATNWHITEICFD
jgi:GNAT superfamily N-acetyltransferase